MMKKLVVVTGASSGIGMEFAKRFSSEGHPVLMLARRKEVMEALNLPNCLCRSVDVTDLSAMQAAIKEAEDLYGKTDLLINCAGLMLLGYPAEQDFEEWSRMIVIAPGVVETPLLSHTSSQEIKDNYNLWKQSIEGGLEPSQIADCAWFAYQMPQNVCVREIVIAKTKQED